MTSSPAGARWLRMKKTTCIFALVTCVVALPASTAPTYKEQAATVEKLREGIEKAEKLRPDQLDKVQAALDISDPSIDKALLRYRIATKNHAALAALKERADPQSLEAAFAEKNHAFLLLGEIYDSVLKNMRVVLEIHEQRLLKLPK